MTGHPESGLVAISSRHPAVGLAVGVIRDGRLRHFHGHGLADIVSRTPVTEDTVFRIGSITKTFTAVAVLQLCERGLIDLDAPAGDYLRAYRLIPAKPGHRPPTVRQLLTHTAGLPQLVYPARAFQPVLGETVACGQRVPALDEFYRGRLHLISEPGTRHTYSNHGFATLGQIVEDVTGQPLSRHFREHIFGPLGMTDTDLARSDRIRARLATGYALRAGGPQAVRDCDLVTAGAGGIYSTTADMARYVAALLAGGCGEDGQILQPETVASMFAPHYQPDPRLPGVGLAFFRQNLGGHLVVEHEGLVPGFNSQMSLAPQDGTGVVAFTNGARSAMTWLGTEVTAILGPMLGASEPVIRADVPHHPEIWTDICGWYSFRGSLRDAQKWFVAGAEVFVRHGQLTLRPVTPLPALAHGLPLHPDDSGDPYVFRIDLSSLGMGTSRVVFSRSPNAVVNAFHLDLSFAPLSFDKQPAARDPRYWVSSALGAVAAATAVNAIRRHRQYAPLRARGRALAAAAAATPSGRQRRAVGSASVAHPRQGRNPGCPLPDPEVVLDPSIQGSYARPRAQREDGDSQGGSDMPSAQLYDTIGATYTVTRRTEPRIAAQTWAALGDARTVLNVGAGTGSYEPPDRHVTAVEPSAVMRAQRPAGAAPCVAAAAESLPFEDQSFDAAMAFATIHHWQDPIAGLREMRRVARHVVVFTHDTSDAGWHRRFWLTRDYLPEIADLLIGRPSLTELARAIGARTEPVLIPWDCADGFFEAYWRRPEAYLDDHVRRGISVWARVGPEAGQRAVRSLRDDLASGRWAERNRDLIALDAAELGLRLLVT